MLEGPLPDEHNEVILDLVFDIATWHAYGKLWKHTDYTLHSFRSQTKELGHQLHTFLKKTLGARGHLPSGYIVSLL